MKFQFEINPRREFFYHCLQLREQHHDVVTKIIEEFQLGVILSCVKGFLSYASPTMQQSMEMKSKRLYFFLYLDYLIARSSSKDPFTIRSKGNTIDFCFMCLNVMNWFVCIVSGIPTIDNYISFSPLF